MAESSSSPSPSETDDEYDFSSSYSVSSEASDNLEPLFEMEIVPYRFEPDAPSSELKSEAHVTTVATETEVADHRIGNTDW